MPMRDLVKRALSHRTIGVPTSLALGAAGLRTASRRIAHLCGYVPQVVSLRAPGGARVRMHSADGKDQFAREAWYAGWQKIEEPLPVVFAALAKGGTVLDVGANTGFYALLAAAAGAARVHAFEPFPAARSWLERNAALSGLTDRVVVVPAAVSGATGTATLYVPTPRFDAVETSSSLESAFRPEHAQTITVPVHSLDDYTRAACPDVRLVKIDVEGHEAPVLEGAGDMLRKLRPFVCLEVLSEESAGRIRATLTSTRYVCLAMRPDSLERIPALTASETSPNQLLCPEERLAELTRQLRRAGLKVTG